MNEKSISGIVIDAANGGDDTGSVQNGIVEKDWNLDISKYIYNRLKEFDVPVKMVRTDDETINNEDRINKILEAFGDNSNVIVISNQLNEGGLTGAEIIYALRNTSKLAISIENELSKEGLTVNKYYQRRLPGDTSKDYYFILRETGDTQPIIIRYGYIDNSSDANKLLNNYEDYGEAVVRGIIQYLGIKYTPPAGETIYIVEAGDSLWSISQKLGVTVAELKAYNNLTSNNLSIGQILLVPPSDEEEEENLYTVKSGDSLWSIANMFGVSVDNIKETNNLTSNTIYVGQQLKIPIKMPETSEPNYIEYIVKSGDSLWAIANKYGTTVDAIKSFNNLTSNNLSIGQSLLIPIKDITTENYFTYTVKSGDSLWAIANKYGTTVDAIKSLNNLTSNNLSIGQQLKIPTNSNTNQISYTVKSGDSLWAIANKYGTTVNEIKSLNSLTSNNLSIGQILLIPIS